MMSVIINLKLQHLPPHHLPGNPLHLTIIHAQGGGGLFREFEPYLAGLTQALRVATELICHHHSISIVKLRLTKNYLSFLCRTPSYFQKFVGLKKLN